MYVYPSQELLQKLAAHEKDFKASKASAEDLIANYLDDSTETESDMTRLKEQWETVNEQAVAKQARLEEAAQVHTHTHTHTHTHAHTHTQTCNPHSFLTCPTPPLPPPPSLL